MACKELGLRPSTGPRALASCIGSVTRWGLAQIVVCGMEIASSWPLRSKIDPRSPGRTTVLILWALPSATYRPEETPWM